MAGKRGRSGGVRVGAGRKPKERELLQVSADDPLDFLLAVMQDGEAAAQLRVRAAVAAAQYMHVKKGEVGKKGEMDGRAQGAARGKYAPPAPPKLVVNNG